MNPQSRLSHTARLAAIEGRNYHQAD